MKNSSQAIKKVTSPFRYAIGMFGTSIPINMFKTYAAIFYVDTLGLSTNRYALVLFIYTFVDAIDNPVYGFLSDRTRTKWGRRRPWMVIGTPLLVLSFILFFTPPASLEGQPLFIYMLLMYILTGTLDSLINANYGALFPELFPSEVKRAKSNSMRQAFQLVAMIISIALTPMVTKQIGYSNTAIIYGALALVVILYCSLGCHENPQAVEMEKPQLWSSLKALFVNSHFWIFGLANAFYSAALVLGMQGVPFFVKYTLKVDAGKTTLMLGSVLVVAIISVAVWVVIVKKITLMPTWRTALLILTLGLIPMYFVTGLGGAIAVSSMVGFGVAGVLVTMDMVGAKIMDEDTKKYGLRREGIYSSAMGFMNRLNGLFTSLAFVLVNRVYGFESGDVPGPNPGGAARFLLIIFPFFCMILSCVFAFLLHFKDDKAQETGVEQAIEEPVDAR
ncbi:MAG: MFS transporter [Clostridiales bacterium]|nr:MFS transporter [Clostridiales bacterium]